MSRPATRLVNFTAARMVPFSVLSLLVSVVVFYGLHNGGVHAVKPSQFKDKEKSRSKTYPSSPFSSIHDMFTSPFEISKFESDGVPTSAQNDNMVLSKNDDMVISENDEVLMARNSGDMLTAKKKSPANHSVLMELARTKGKKLGMKTSTSGRGCCNGDTSSVADKGCCNGEKSFERDCCIGDRTTSVSVGIGGTHKKDEADTVYHQIFEALGVSYNQQTGAQPSTSTFVSLDYASVVRKELENACALYYKHPLPALSKLASPGKLEISFTSSFLLVTTLNSVFDTFFNIMENMKRQRDYSAAFQDETCGDPSSDTNGEKSGTDETTRQAAKDRADSFNNNVCELRGKYAKKFNPTKNRLESKYEQDLSNAANDYQREFERATKSTQIGSKELRDLYEALEMGSTNVTGLTMPKMYGFGRGQVGGVSASVKGCRTLPSGKEINDFEDYLRELKDIIKVAKHGMEPVVSAKAIAILGNYTEARNKAQRMYSSKTMNDTILAEYALRLFALAAPSQNPADERQKNPFAFDKDASKEDEDDERCTNLLKKQAAIEYLGVVPSSNIDLTKWYDDIFLDRVKKAQEVELEVFDEYAGITNRYMAATFGFLYVVVSILLWKQGWGDWSPVSCFYVVTNLFPLLLHFFCFLVSSWRGCPGRESCLGILHHASLKRKKTAYIDCVSSAAFCDNLFALCFFGVVIYDLITGSKILISKCWKGTILIFLCFIGSMVRAWAAARSISKFENSTILEFLKRNLRNIALLGCWTPTFERKIFGGFDNGGNGDEDKGGEDIAEPSFIQEDASSSYHIV